MRRKDREKDQEFAKQIFADCEYATFATVDSNNIPYAVPISVVIEGDYLYFHAAVEGRKLSNLKSNNYVCMSCVSYTKLLPYSFTTEYKSAVAFGKAYIVLDESEKIKALKLITLKYAAENIASFDEEIASAIDRTVVIRVEIDEITGKANTSS